MAVRHNIRAVLENVTLEELASGQLPWQIDAMLNDPQTWLKR